MGAETKWALAKGHCELPVSLQALRSPLSSGTAGFPPLAKPRPKEDSDSPSSEDANLPFPKDRRQDVSANSTRGDASQSSSFGKQKLAEMVRGCSKAFAVLVDLDYTLWPFFLDREARGPPFVAAGLGLAQDCNGKLLKLNQQVPQVLCFLHKLRVPVVVCSRSQAPSWCWDIFKCFLLESGAERLTLHRIAHSGSVIRPASSKVMHLHEIQGKLQLPFDRFLFFDDEPNMCKEGRSLGVKCIQVPKSTGLTWKLFKDGLTMML